MTKAVWLIMGDFSIFGIEYTWNKGHKIVVVVVAV